jgi:hypothetical protein
MVKKSPSGNAWAGLQAMRSLQRSVVPFTLQKSVSKLYFRCNAGLGLRVKGPGSFIYNTKT